MDGDLSALNFTPNAGSQYRTSTFHAAGRSSSLLTRTFYFEYLIWKMQSYIWCYVIFSGLTTLRVASALAILQQHVLKRSAAEDGPVPVNSFSLWTNLRLLIKTIW